MAKDKKTGGFQTNAANAQYENPRLANLANLGARQTLESNQVTGYTNQRLANLANLGTQSAIDQLMRAMDQARTPYFGLRRTEERDALVNPTPASRFDPGWLAAPSTRDAQDEAVRQFDLAAETLAARGGGTLFSNEELERQAAQYTANANRAQTAAENRQRQINSFAPAAAQARTYQYEKNRLNPDFSDLSRYQTTAVGEGREVPDLDYNTGKTTGGTHREYEYGDLAYDFINQNRDAAAQWSYNAVRNNAGLLGMDNRELRQMTPDEIAMFDYLYAKDTEAGDQTHKNAYEYIRFIQSDPLYASGDGTLNARQRAEETAQAAAFAQAHPGAASVGTVLANPLKAITYLSQAADFIDDGKMEADAGYNRYSYLNSAARDAVTKQIEKTWSKKGKFAGKAATFAYQTGMSMADFLFNTAITGGFAGGGAASEAFALTLMGTEAAADATMAAKDRGLDDAQAFAIGTIAGAAEIITEKFSIEALLNNVGRAGLSYWLKNAFTEGAEEIGSDFINLFADVLIAKDKGEWQAAIDAYVAMGYSEKEAFSKAVADQAKQMGASFLGGALSGGVMGGAGAVRIGFLNNAQGADYQAQARLAGTETDALRALTEAGLQSGDAEVVRLSQNVKDRLDAGKKVSNRAVGRLAYELDETLGDTEDEIPEQPVNQRWSRPHSIEEYAAGRTGRPFTRYTDIVKTDELGRIAPLLQVENIAMMTMGERGYKAASMYRSRANEVGPAEYYNEARTVYDQGMAGTEMQKAGDILSDAEMKAWYDAGKADAITRGDVQNGEQIAEQSGNEGQGRFDRLDTAEQGERLDRGAEAPVAQNGGGRSAGPQNAGVAEGIRAQKAAAEKLAANVPMSSSAEKGISTGTNFKTFREIPDSTRDQWTDKMKSVTAKAEKAGVKVHWYTGRMILDDGHGAFAVRGLNVGDGSEIWVRADADEDIEKIADHELFHTEEKRNPELVNDIRRKITEGKQDDLLLAMIRKYQDKYRGAGMSDEQVLSEIFADAYAGIDVFAGITENANATPAQRVRAPQFNQQVTEAVQSSQPAGAVQNTETTASRDGVPPGVERTLEKYDATVQDGVVVNNSIAPIMASPAYHKPVSVSDLADMASHDTLPEWAQKYLNGGGSAEVLQAIQQFDDMIWKDMGDGFTDAQKLLQALVPSGTVITDKYGPLRTNVEYRRSFDMDTSCPRTFQFTAYRNAIMKRLNRTLTLAESINLINLMAAYHQMIPCTYCYVENKRILKASYYNNFYKFHNDVLNGIKNGLTIDDLRPQMYGWNAEKGKLTDAAEKTLKVWMDDKSGYNPTITENYHTVNLIRNAAMHLLDGMISDGKITANTSVNSLTNIIAKEYGLKSKGALTEAKKMAKDWRYDAGRNAEHMYLVQDTGEAFDTKIADRALELDNEAINYANSASSAKTVDNYAPYGGELENISEEDRDFIMGMGGIRKHSSNDFRIDYVLDYFQFYADLAKGKWRGHTYTKNGDYVRIFGRTGDMINMSIAFNDTADGVVENVSEGMEHALAKELRAAFPNAGVMAMVTSDKQLSYALNADWVDMIIPFHNSGLPKEIWYNMKAWADYTSVQSESLYNSDDMKAALQSRGVDLNEIALNAARELAKAEGLNSEAMSYNEIEEALKKKAKEEDRKINLSGAVTEAIQDKFYETFGIKKAIDKKTGKQFAPHFYPYETTQHGVKIPGHNNSKARYMELCREYGVHPRFDGVQVQDADGNTINVVDHQNYMKLVKETSRATENFDQPTIEFNFNKADPYLTEKYGKEFGKKSVTPMDYAMARLDQEAKNGGYLNAADDPMGIVDEFIRDYAGKGREIGWLSERAEITKEELDKAQDRLVELARKQTLEEFKKTEGKKPKPKVRSNFYTDMANEGTQKTPAITNMASREVETIPQGTVPATRNESLTMDATDDRNVLRYRNEISAVLDGTMPSNQIVLIGIPSTILAKYLKSNNPLYISQNSVKHIVLPKTEKSGKHGFGRAVLDQIVYQFEDPMAITGNTTKHVESGDNSIIVWTDWKNDAGDSIIVPIRIDVDGSIGIYNNINTAFNAWDKSYVEDILRDGNVFYTRDGKSIDDLLAQRRDMPKWKIEDASSKDSIDEESGNVNSNMASREMDNAYMNAVNSGDMETAQRMVDEAAKAAGYTRRAFHQTSAKNITVFDLSIGTNGGTDSETPYGVFTKRTNADIGLGDVQMSLYVRPGKTLRFKNREELHRYFGGEYKAILDEIDAVNNRYDKLYEAASDEAADQQDKWLDAHPEIDTMSMPVEEFLKGDFYTGKEVRAAMDKADSIMSRWTDSVNKLSVKAKEVLTEMLKAEGYDSVEILVDSGSGGRKTDTFISLDNMAVKSADPVTYDDAGNIIPLSERFNQENPDIRYSRESDNRLEQQNIDLQKRLDAALNETKLTTAWRAAAKDVDRVTADIIDATSSKESKTIVAQKIRSLVEAASNGGITSAEMKDLALDIARGLLKRSSVLTSPDSTTYDGMRKYLKSLYINVPMELRKQMDWKAFAAAHKAMRMKTSGVDISTVYDELRRQLGEDYFPQLTDDMDKLQQIAEILDNLTPIYDNPYSVNMAEATEETANGILEAILDIGQAEPTYADRAKAREGEVRSLYQEKLAAQKESMQQRLQEEADRRREQIEAIKQEYRDMNERRRNRKQESADRQKLLRVAKRLQNRKLDTFNRILIDKLVGDLDTVSVNLTNKSLTNLRELADWYDSYKDDPNFLSVPQVEEKLKRLEKRHIGDMTIDEVRDLTDVLLSIEVSLANYGKMIRTEDRRLVSEMSLQSQENIRNTRGKKSELGNWLATNTLSPERLVRRLTGYEENDPLLLRTKELSDGQRKMFDYQMRAEALFSKWTNDAKLIDRLRNKDTVTIRGFVDGKETTAEITPDMRMALYLHSLNDQNLKHIANGGVTIPDIELYRKGKTADAYAAGVTMKLSPDMVRGIANWMSAEERAFANAAHRYFNGMSRDEINNVSEELLGYSLAGVENYFPIQTDDAFTQKEIDAIQNDGTIQGMGFTKERVNASNAIYLVPMIDVLNRSIQNHAKYVGMAIPVANMNKLWKALTVDGETDSTHGLKDVMRAKWGTSANEAIDNILTDVQNPRNKQDGLGKLLARMRSNYAGAVLSMNFGVAMKQAASYPTAAAVLGWTPIRQALGDLSKVDMDLIAKYTPLLWYRSKGYSTQELGDIHKRGGIMDKVMSAHVTTKGGKEIPLLNWIQGVDLLTTKRLWKASEYYVRAHNKDLKVGSDDFYKEVAKIYNRVIEETQPNYTTMQRPQLLRTNNQLTQSLVMFKTQPFQNFNILYDAIGELRAAERLAKNGDSSKLAQAKKNVVNAVSSNIVSAITFAAMTMAYSLFRRKKENYQDEEGNFRPWKQLGKDFLSSEFGMLPFGSDLYNVIASLAFDQRYYGISNVTTDSLAGVVESAYNAAKTMTDALSAIFDGDEKTTPNPEKMARTLFSCAQDVSKAFGIPLDNVVNLMSAAYANIASGINGEFVTSYKMLRLMKGISSSANKAAAYDLLYKAYQNNPDEYQKILDEMIGSGDFSEASIKSAMEKRMKAAQGDLGQRWMMPDQQKVYDTVRSGIENTEVYNAATEDQIAALDDVMYQYAIGSKSGTTTAEKIAGGEAYGLDENEYFQYLLALKVADQPNASGKMGTYTNEEQEQAIRMVEGLDDAERSYLWGLTHDSDKNNPFSATSAEPASTPQPSPQPSPTPKASEKPSQKPQTKTEPETADVTGSTAIKAATYDPDTQTAHITYNSGRTYDYYNITAEEWEAFKSADSKGSYVNRNWK